MASFCRAQFCALLPGTDELYGKLPRLLADVATENDAIAILAANFVRYSNQRWRLFSFVGESVSAVNIALLLNGVFQANLEYSLRLAIYNDEPNPAIYMGIAATITTLPAALVVFKLASSPWDGIPTEVEAVTRTNSTIGAYFNMQSLPSETSPIEASHHF
jgi:hypothetical protein